MNTHSWTVKCVEWRVVLTMKVYAAPSANNFIAKTPKSSTPTRTTCKGCTRHFLRADGEELASSRLGLLQLLQHMSCLPLQVIHSVVVDLAVGSLLIAELLQVAHDGLVLLAERVQPVGQRRSDDLVGVFRESLDELLVLREPLGQPQHSVDRHVVPGVLLDLLERVADGDGHHST